MAEAITEMKYVLTVMSPTGDEKRFESNTPFMAIGVGESLNMRFFQDADGFNLPLEIVDIEHMIWHDETTGDLTHTIYVYTKRGGLD